MNPADLSVEQALQEMRDKTLSARELVTAHLDRIDERNGELDAFVYLDRDGALTAALAADEVLMRGEPIGPLHGIPVALKDLINTAHMPTQYGSRLFAGHRPESDAECVSLLKNAGAIILGKVATYEFAAVGPSFDTPFPPAKNPWNKDHITGGSSSGSASAVAGGLVRIAIGTDTGGSVRSPSSYCGITGFKPATRRISKSGVFPLSPGLDCVGPLAATARDAAIAYSVLADEHDAHKLGDQPGERLEGIHGRVGVDPVADGDR
jgi:aspartyl-tRNA(Asn)/glutamyl-tRNA(Gln) amidotransferase subunit A